MRAGRSLVKTDDRAGVRPVCACDARHVAAGVDDIAALAEIQDGQRAPEGVGDDRDPCDGKNCGLVENRAAGIATRCATIGRALAGLVATQSRRRTRRLSS
jgi:hypothetical protein